MAKTFNELRRKMSPERRIRNEARAKAVMIPRRCPSHPGPVLLEEFLRPLGMTQQALATKMGVSVQRVNTLVAGKRGVTAETAILLARVLRTSPEFWMNLQSNFDLWHAAQRLGSV